MRIKMASVLSLGQFEYHTIVDSKKRGAFYIKLGSNGKLLSKKFKGEVARYFSWGRDFLLFGIWIIMNYYIS